jgi:hypothetical protein
MAGTNKFKFGGSGYGLPGSGIRQVEFIGCDGLSGSGVAGTNKFNFGCHGLPGSGIRWVKFIRCDGLSCSSVAGPNKFNFGGRTIYSCGTGSDATATSTSDRAARTRASRCTDSCGNYGTGYACAHTASICTGSSTAAAGFGGNH